MSNAPLRTPVAFLVYNRPEMTRKVFARIRAARPQVLLVVADGPHPGRPADPALCTEVRSLIVNGVDWPCQLKTDFAPANMGCGKRVATGLSWVFANVPEAIVLEDDCLPVPGFFRFCEELLERYRDQDAIGQICGLRPVASAARATDASYCFSKYAPIWGWASWARAWKAYDFEIGEWSPNSSIAEFRRCGLSVREAVWRTTVNARLRNGQLDTWDYQWDYARLKNRMLGVIPSVSMIQNIGIGPQSTHTRRGPAYPPARPISFPLVHPAGQLPSSEFDAAFARQFLPCWPRVVWQWLKHRPARSSGGDKQASRLKSVPDDRP